MTKALPGDSQHDECFANHGRGDLTAHLRGRPPVLTGPAATRVSRIGNPEDLAPSMWFTGV